MKYCVKVLRQTDEVLRHYRAKNYLNGQLLYYCCDPPASWFRVSRPCQTRGVNSLVDHHEVAII